MIDIIFALLILVIALVLTVSSTITIESSGGKSIKYMPLAAMICTMIGIAVLCYDDSPKAIDVYRGKTTLEITYRDSIPIDSTVVYKKR